MSVRYPQSLVGSLRSFVLDFEGICSGLLNLALAAALPVGMVFLIWSGSNFAWRLISSEELRGFGFVMVAGLLVIIYVLVRGMFFPHLSRRD